MTVAGSAGSAERRRERLPRAARVRLRSDYLAIQNGGGEPRGRPPSAFAYEIHACAGGSCDGAETSSYSRLPPRHHVAFPPRRMRGGKAHLHSIGPLECQRRPREGNHGCSNRSGGFRRRIRAGVPRNFAPTVERISISRVSYAQAPMACGFPPSNTGNAHEIRRGPIFISAMNRKRARVRLLTSEMQFAGLPHASLP